MSCEYLVGPRRTMTQIGAPFAKYPISRAGAELAISAIHFGHVMKSTFESESFPSENNKVISFPFKVPELFSEPARAQWSGIV